MHVTFNFHGNAYQANLARQGDNKLVVQLNDDNLEKQFGSSLPFYLHDRSVEFNLLNKSHSELFALNSSISKAIAEQCTDLLVNATVE